MKGWYRISLTCFRFG